MAWALLRGGGGARKTVPAAASLYLCALTHSYLLFNVFPYAGYMAVFLLSRSGPAPDDAAAAVTVDSVGLYAGLLGTSFALGRTAGFVPWRSLRRSLGEKRALFSSLLLSALFSLLFGTAGTFAGACASRFGLGLSNGISGAVKRAALDGARSRAAERRRRRRSAEGDGGGGGDGEEEDEEDEEHHHDDDDEVERAPGRILAVMSWGCALGPALGGALTAYSPPSAHGDGASSGDDAAPTTQTPLGRHPFLLPNLAGALLCAASAAAVWAFVEDGRDEEGERSHERPFEEAAEAMGNIFKSPSLWVRGSRTDLSSAAPEGGGGGGGGGGGESQPLLPMTTTRAAAAGGGGADGSKGRAWYSNVAEIWKSEDARRHLAAYWTFSFVAVCVDEALPLFLIARLGGLGMSAPSAGWTLSGAGLVLVLCQRATQDFLLGRAGLYPALRVGAALGTVPVALLPLAVTLNGGPCAVLDGDGDDGGSAAFCGATASAFAFLVLLGGSVKVFSSLFFTEIGVAAGRTVPPTHRDEAVRTMTWGALAARSAAPVLAGALASYSLSPSSPSPWEDPRVGPVFLWSVIGLVLGSAATAMSLFLHEASAGKLSDRRSREREDRRSLYLSQRQRAQVYIKMWEVHYDQGSKTVGAKWRKAARKVIAVNRFKKGALVERDDASPGGAEMTEAAQERKRNNLRTSWTDRMLRTGMDPSVVPFVILGTHKNDPSCKPHVLSPPLMDALHQALPYSCSNMNFWLKYSLVRDGASMEALVRKVARSKYTILAIETMNGYVFGSFNSKPWQRTDRYVGSGQSFLWRMKKPRPLAPDAAGEESVEERADREGDVDVYRYTGENDMCQLLGDDRIAVGGGLPAGAGGGDGFGLVVTDDLETGSSGPCVTYGNPCLCRSGAENGRFEVANVEVWALTSFLLLEDADKSERHARFVEENRCPESAWSNFL